MSSIRLCSLTKRFGPLVAVDTLDLELQQGELVAFLGPSGCGKTTTLRMIAGFERADAGAIYLGGREVTDLPPEHRDTGMVFQNYALFPHLTVFENVAFGLQMRKMPKSDIANRVADILAKVQLTGLEKRYPRQLSGGQQQRTALARALVINPTVLLLDEPLANLDAKLREEMRFYIRHLQQEFGITTVYVTHDQAEALVLADRVAVMKDGVLQQVDAPEAIYRYPSNAWIAGFVGIGNLIPGTVAGYDDGIHQVDSVVGRLHGVAGEPMAPGTAVLINVRPESLRLQAASEAEERRDAASGAPSNQLDGIVAERAYLGNLADYRVRAGPGADLVLRVQAEPYPIFQVNDAVRLTFTPDQAWLIAADERAAP
jgi:putative spermidine/putrescine transport system ATP-binding protein